VIEIDSTKNLYEAFQLLLEKNILSAPVYDQATSKYTGFLDVRDLNSFVVFVHDEQKVHNNTQLADLITHGESQFKTATTDGVSVKYLSRRNRFHPVAGTDTLFKVCEYLSAPDIHRVPVLENGKVSTLITQTTIIKFLYKHIPVPIDNSQDPTLGQLNIGSSPVLSVQKKKVLLLHFEKWKKSNEVALLLLTSKAY